MCIRDRDCAECGIASDVYRLPEDTGEAELLARVAALNSDPAVHGILVQLPLPPHIRETAVLEAIAPEKDVDGFTPVNTGRLAAGQMENCFVPCTPAGCMEMLRAAGVDPAGKRAVVLGRSNIVGKPMAMLLTAADATVTLCHSKTVSYTHLDVYKRQAETIDPSADVDGIDAQRKISILASIMWGRQFLSLIHI